MESIALWGTIVNTLAIVLGAFAGLLVFRAGNRIGARSASPQQAAEETPLQHPLQDFLFRGVGLCVCLIGLSGALEGTLRRLIGTADAVVSHETLIVILSVVIGALIGHFLDLDGRLNRLGQWLERKLKGRFGNVSNGFVTASLLFCVGAMAISGAFASGMRLDHSVQYAKALLDGIASVILASTLGFGVMLSAGSVFVYQGTVTLMACILGNFLPEAVILEMNVTGSLLILALGLNMIGATKLKVMNYLPAMFLPIALVPLFSWITG